MTDGIVASKILTRRSRRKEKCHFYISDINALVVIAFSEVKKNFTSERIKHEFSPCSPTSPRPQCFKT